MTIKKLNAVIALITSLALFVHIGYSAFAYLTFYYLLFSLSASSMLYLSFSPISFITSCALYFQS